MAKGGAPYNAVNRTDYTAQPVENEVGETRFLRECLIRNELSMRLRYGSTTKVSEGPIRLQRRWPKLHCSPADA